MEDSIFRRLWGEGLPEGAALLVWTLPNRASIWCWSIEEAEQAVARWAPAGFDIYYGVCLVADPQAVSQRKGIQLGHVRGDASDASHIAAVWADVDDPSVWMDLLAEQPTFVVLSGHGFHAYWVLDQPVAIHGDRAKWESIVAGWQRELGQRLGIKLDAAWDLARVLRVPGTMNYKRTPYEPVEFLEYQGPTYSPEDFEKYAGTEVRNHTGGSTAELELPNAPNISILKLEALLESDTRVRQTWERRRRDLKDDSASGYDLALANYAARAEWSAQEICDLLVAFRQKHGEPIKDSIKRTVSLALADTNLERAPESASREDLLAHLSERWGIKIERFVKYPGDRTIYELHLEGVEPLVIGTADKLRSQDGVLNAIVDLTNKVVPKVKQGVWERHLQILMDVTEVATTGTEAYEKSSMSELIGQYLESRKPIDEHDEPDAYNNAIISRNPVKRRGDVYITTSKMAWWLKTSYGENRTAGEIAGIFARLGMVSTTIVTTSRDARTSRTYWKVR